MTQNSQYLGIDPALFLTSSSFSSHDYSQGREGGSRQLPNCCSKTGVGGAALFLSVFRGKIFPPLRSLPSSIRRTESLKDFLPGSEIGRLECSALNCDRIIQPPNLETWENPFLGTLYSCVHNDGFLFSSLSPSSQVGRRSNFETWRRPRPRAICGRG